MARTDAIVLGAGIVGVSAALHLVKRGLTVALVDRRGAGEETSYGNAGVIEGNTLFAHAFPKGFGALLRIALKQAPEANYHLSALPELAPWLLAYRANTRGHLVAIGGRSSIYRGVYTRDKRAIGTADVAAALHSAP